jgi:tRNA pseudouridine38-40 synthase
MRYALGIEYDGAGFCGWQRQDHAPSVQSSVEQAIGIVADHQVTVICAGRTDTGVHAFCQVAHFDSDSRRSERQWVLGVNSRLPSTVRVLWARQVDDSFHARFSAHSRSYRYRIMNRWVRPAIGFNRYAWCRHKLDAARMHEAAQYLLGTQDFSAFRSAGCSSQHAVREVTSISVTRCGDIVNMDITANAFLYHMVRNIVGSLTEVGKGEQPPEWIADLLAGRDRTVAGVTAEPQGLYFMSVRYDPIYGLPDSAESFAEAEALE